MPCVGCVCACRMHLEADIGVIPETEEILKAAQKAAAASVKAHK